LRKARPDIVIKIWWCPAHQGVVGNNEADKWAKLAAEEPDTHGVEWLGFADKYGRRPMPLPRSLAGDIREEVGRGAEPGGGTHHVKKVQDAEGTAAEQSGREMPEETGQPFLPAEDGPLSYWAISHVVEELLHSGMRVVLL
jgi:hypothetical protein